MAFQFKLNKPKLGIKNYKMSLADKMRPKRFGMPSGIKVNKGLGLPKVLK